METEDFDSMDSAQQPRLLWFDGVDNNSAWRVPERRLTLAPGVTPPRQSTESNPNDLRHHSQHSAWRECFSSGSDLTATTDDDMAASDGAGIRFSPGRDSHGDRADETSSIQQPKMRLTPRTAFVGAPGDESFGETVLNAFREFSRLATSFFMRGP